MHGASRSFEVEMLELENLSMSVHRAWHAPKAAAGAREDNDTEQMLDLVRIV